MRYRAVRQWTWARRRAGAVFGLASIVIVGSGLGVAGRSAAALPRRGNLLDGATLLLGEATQRDTANPLADARPRDGAQIGCDARTPLS
jgi:hypothetical protein